MQIAATDTGWTSSSGLPLYHFFTTPKALRIQDFLSGQQQASRLSGGGSVKKTRRLRRLADTGTENNRSIVPPIRVCDNSNTSQMATCIWHIFNCVEITNSAQAYMGAITCGLALYVYEWYSRMTASEQGRPLHWQVEQDASWKKLGGS